MIPIRDDIRSRKFPLFTILLIAVNILIYIYQNLIYVEPELFVWKYALVAKSLISFQPLNPVSTLPPPLTLITSQFLHGDIFHLGSNMLFLWVFGDNIEAELGYFKYLGFYLTCGIISGIVQVIAFPGSTIPMVGASGAISGIMGAYLLRFPKARVVTWLFFIFFVRLPAVVYLGLWIIFQIVAGVPTYGNDGDGVAYFAHIGGFIAGMVLFKVWKK